MADLNILIWVVIFVISILIFGSVYLLYKGLQNPEQVSQIPTGIGFSLIFFVFAFLFFVTSLDGLLLYASFFLFLICVLATNLTVLILRKKLPDGRKSFRQLIVAGYTVGFCVSVFFGYLFTPTQRIKRDGWGVIRALEEYHNRQGFYPRSLVDLKSSSTIRFVETPPTLWGWLYTATDDDFSLGFIRDVDKFGYWICLYPSKSRQWDCVPEAKTPFRPDPTPGIYENNSFPTFPSR
jgi:hypothetical protein